ncbi:hypothetical protein BaRGS_00022858 [Batillaria attramentaria]|uniref:Pyridoxal phosphate homeostasis protein n=1 Tax=Batillaria attramentaria TaxID=370345 RepID=A0ABD0KFE0_9CAEN
MGSKAPDIVRQLKFVIDRVNAAARSRPPHLQGKEPRLVAVSKTKPSLMIVEAYTSGQRHFGENYVQELVEKSTDPQILQNCADLRWHFIGNLQKNKVNKITGVPNLFMVETVDSEKLAMALNNSWGKLSRGEPLRIMVQVNTSGEENKSGVKPSEASALALFVRDKCPHLQLAGLMTIGSYESSTTATVNPDFQCLVQCRKEVAEALGVAELDLELSMGMSHDFEHAIETGSTNVRVGSTIFGARQYPPKPDSAASGAASEPNPSSASTSASTAGPGGDSAKQCSSTDKVEVAETELHSLSLNSS